MIPRDENKAEDWYKKDFRSSVVPSFCEGNNLVEVEENDSNDTPIYDVDAHKAVLCYYGYFF